MDLQTQEMFKNIFRYSNPIYASEQETPQQIVSVNIAAPNVEQAILIKTYCKKLTTLKIRDQQILPNVITQLSQINTLRKFAIRPTDIQPIIKQISKISQLKSLKIDCENFNCDNLKQIVDGIPLLQQIIFNRVNQLTDGTDILKKLHHLKSIQLHWMLLTKASLNPILNILQTKLQKIVIQSCQYQDQSIFTSLQKLPLLKQIGLYNCQLQQYIYSHIFSLLPTTLESIDISWKQFTNQTYNYVFERCPNVRIIQLQNCNLFDTQLTIICNLVSKQLKQLNLLYNHNITFNGISLISRKFQNLTLLNLGCCRGIMNKSFKEISKLQKLQQLILHESGISDHGVTYLRTLRNLKKLELRGNEISYQIIVKVIVNLKKLKQLGISREEQDDKKQLRNYKQILIGEIL